MIVKSKAAREVTFEGLEIRDYTPRHEHSSSLATIEIPPGIHHGNARSTRSDKYYFVIEGEVRFTLGSREHHLVRGDFCLVPKGTLFGYKSDTSVTSTLLLFPTPSFDLSAEVFED